MSDRVGYPVGNTANRDHVYWPALTEAQIPNLSPAPDPSEYDGIWPIDLSILQMMALAWRVKKWRLSGNISATKTRAGDTISATASLEETDVFLLKFDNDLSEEVPITREQEILYTYYEMPYLATKFRFLGNDGLGPVGESTVIVNWETTGNVNGDWSGTEDVPFKMFTTWPLLFKPGPTLAQPCFGFGIVIPAVIAGNQLIVRVDFDRNPETDTSGPIELLEAGMMTVIPGITSSFNIPMQIGWRFLGDEPGGSGSASAGFTLEAMEYWPYANSQGLPVYDTGTGSVINSPFS